VRIRQIDVRRVDGFHGRLLREDGYRDDTPCYQSRRVPRTR
jgi:hypothetical protein